MAENTVYTIRQTSSLFLFETEWRNGRVEVMRWYNYQEMVGMKTIGMRKKEKRVENMKDGVFIISYFGL